MRLPAVLALLLACLTLGACGSDDDGGDGAATPAASASATTAGCKDVEAPDPKPDGGAEEPEGRLDPAKTWTATVTTSCGDFTITLDAKEHPKTAASFASLARQGFYDGTIFHRIVPGFVIQGGDPTGEGTGGPGYTVREAPGSDTRYLKGVVAMAKTQSEDPGTSGSQFYVVTGADAALPPDYAVAGEVTDGLDVVERIGRLGDPATEQPTQPVVVDAVRIASA